MRDKEPRAASSNKMEILSGMLFDAKVKHDILRFESS